MMVYDFVWLKGFQPYIAFSEFEVDPLFEDYWSRFYDKRVRKVGSLEDIREEAYDSVREFLIIVSYKPEIWWAETMYLVLKKGEEDDGL